MYIDSPGEIAKLQLNNMCFSGQAIGHHSCCLVLNDLKGPDQVFFTATPQRDQVGQLAHEDAISQHFSGFKSCYLTNHFQSTEPSSETPDQTFITVLNMLCPLKILMDHASQKFF